MFFKQEWIYIILYKVFHYYVKKNCKLLYPSVVCLNDLIMKPR